jgi:hypothetical protein
MGSTARRRGAYGGEYLPIGLRLFTWWKKNGKTRLQKPGSGTAETRLQRPVRSGPLIGASVNVRASILSATALLRTTHEQNRVDHIDRSLLGQAGARRQARSQPSGAHGRPSAKTH